MSQPETDVSSYPQMFSLFLAVYIIRNIMCQKTEVAHDSEAESWGENCLRVCVSCYSSEELASCIIIDKLKYAAADASERQRRPGGPEPVGKDLSGKVSKMKNSRRILTGIPTMREMSKKASFMRQQHFYNWPLLMHFAFTHTFDDFYAFLCFFFFLPKPNSK